MKKIIVLGAGMVGKAIAIDLCKDYAVTSVDVNQATLDFLKANYPIQTRSYNLQDTSKIHELVHDYDLVIEAVPGFMGYATLKALILAKKNVVDISFFPEDAFMLDKLALENQVTAIVDCGVAPGMSNFMLGYYARIMDVTHFECLVGGLPQVREWPFEYKAPFSPIDVLEEYTRMARYVENGHCVTKAPLSDPELIFFPGIGTLESFNTDGLRTLINTLGHIPNMKEKTLRYPGHIRYIQALKDAGFFDLEPISIDHAQVRPLDFTAKILFKKWKLMPKEAEFTVMRITIKGQQQGKEKTIVYDLLDHYDPQTQLSSMARTTGFTATAVAQLVLNGQFKRQGICPPEYVAQEPGCFEPVLQYLAARNIHYRQT